MVSAEDRAERGQQVLEGVRILDLTRHMAGPYATAFLSDFGADVIKVEGMPHGDASRRTGVHFHGEESALFLQWNRGKRSAAINLRDPEGVAVVRQLARRADVFIQNYRPGVAERIGIGPDALMADNPGLVYVSISAFGRGSRENDPGTDPIVQAMSGVMSVTGEPDRGPALVGVPIADFVGAMMAITAVNMGLLARASSGRGQHIEVPMLHGLMSALSTRLAAFWADGQDPVRHGGAHSAVAPYQAYETADGWAVAGVWGPRGWPGFCRAVGRIDLIEDPRFATNPDRVRNRSVLNQELIPLFRTRSRSEWADAFAESGALFGPVNSFSEAFDHPHVRDSSFVQTVNHADVGEIRQLGPPIFLSETPGAIAGPPPAFGADTVDVLREGGIDDDVIQRLQKADVVGGPAV